MAAIKTPPPTPLNKYAVIFLIYSGNNSTIIFYSEPIEDNFRTPHWFLVALVE